MTQQLESRIRRAGLRARGALSLLRYEMKVLTGGRVSILAILLGLWFGMAVLIDVLSDEPWETASLYNSMVALPVFMQAVALAMVAVMGERDGGTLEVTFATPLGRHAVWAFRISALLLSCGVSALVLSGLTTLVIDREHPWLGAAGHAMFPLSLAVGATVMFSVLFKSSQVAGLLTSVLAGLSFLFLHPPRWVADVWFNPYVPPFGDGDAYTWERGIVHAHSWQGAVALLCIAFTLWLLQHRERLL